jgi:hypothetical protein
MLSLEDLVTLSCEKEQLFGDGKYQSSHLSAKLVKRLISICFPIKLAHVYSIKRQELLLLLLNKCSKYPKYLDIVIFSIFSFLEDTDFHDVTWISCCESGYLHRLLRSLFLMLPNANQSTFVSFIVRKLGSLSVSSNISAPSHSNQLFEKRNRLLIASEFFHIIGIARKSGNVSWLDHSETIVEAGHKVITDNNLFSSLDTEFSSVFFIKILISYQTILFELLSSTSSLSLSSTLSSSFLSKTCSLIYEDAEKLLVYLQTKECCYMKSLNEIALLVCLKVLQILKDQRLITIVKVIPFLPFFMFFFLQFSVFCLPFLSRCF